MLIEKSQQLIELSENKINLLNIANNLQEFKTRQEQIADAVTAIQPLVEALKAFRQKGIANFDLTQKADTLLNFIIAAEDNFRQDPNWITENFNGKTFKSNIENFKKALEQQLIQNWKTYLAEHMPTTNNELLTLLSRIDAFKQTVQEVKIIDVQIKQAIYPKDIREFEIAEARIEQLKQCWKNLSSDEVPKSVLSFLRVATSQGAPLSLLTQEVQDWIKQHGISESFKINLA